MHSIHSPGCICPVPALRQAHCWALWLQTCPSRDGSTSLPVSVSRRTGGPEAERLHPAPFCCVPISREAAPSPAGGPTVTGQRLCHPVSREGRLGPYGTSEEALWLVSSACGLPLPVFRCVCGFIHWCSKHLLNAAFVPASVPQRPGSCRRWCWGSRMLGTLVGGPAVLALSLPQGRA